MSYIVGAIIISVIIYLLWFAGVKENDADKFKNMLKERDKKKDDHKQ